ncbi:MAG: hypothetical protein JOZ15_20485, partial [Acidobacteria bacterium]|nr:hypothetical protein [Acidobacteriota bacterium]
RRGRRRLGLAGDRRGAGLPDDRRGTGLAEGRGACGLGQERRQGRLVERRRPDRQRGLGGGLARRPVGLRRRWRLPRQGKGLRQLGLRALQLRLGLGQLRLRQLERSGIVAGGRGLLSRQT